MIAAPGLSHLADHPQRIELNDEVHARPSEVLIAPLRISYMALYSDWTEREAHWQCVAALAARFGVAPPPPGANHFSADFGEFRLTWERHTEFTRYSFIAPLLGDDPFAVQAVAAVPADWLATLKGQVMVAAHVALVRDPGTALDPEATARQYFAGNALVGSVIGGGAGVALTDFRIREDGFSRCLIYDRQLAPRQAGRMVQRLVEIDTYRMMALLALPVARELAPFLSQRERALASITTLLASSAEQNEPDLLHRLTQLEAEIGERAADNHYRFSAGTAYYELVERRIDELREERIQGLQTFREFTERRLAPAMNTCRAVARRQDSLSLRVARATQLLSTRVDIARQGQSQVLLASMNRRAELQLRLQQTVEGLSVAAITYYLVGLVGYAVKGLKTLGVGFDPDFAMGLSVPVVALIAALGVRRLRRHVGKSGDGL